MTANTPTGTIRDPVGDLLSHALTVAAGAAVMLIALPLVIPFLVNAILTDTVATKTRFWQVHRHHLLVNISGILLVCGLIATEVVLTVRWTTSGQAQVFFAGDPWAHLIATFAPWAAVNLLSGLLLLPVTWSIRRRNIARRVQSRAIADVLLQERIEGARKRAADQAAASRIGIRLDSVTGKITGTAGTVLTVPLLVSGRQAFGFTTQPTIRTMADRFRDVRTVRDWVDHTNRFLVLPNTASAVRALIVAESGSGKTVLINGLVLCALKQGWPVFLLDAKGDPADADTLTRTASSYGHRTQIGGRWDLFNGTADQVTGKLMRLMPVPDGANQHYLDEIRGVLQAVQNDTPIRSVTDLRTRLTDPGPYVRDQFDLLMVNQTVDRNGTTAGARALHSLLVALRPLESYIGDDGWSYSNPTADLTVIPLSPVDDAQARLGDLLMLDLRNFLAARLQAGDKSPVLVVADEFPQLVTAGQDPGDTAGSLFETARSAGIGLVLATQSPAGLSNDDIRRRRALTSGAALIFGRSKDPEEIVKYAGTVLRMEASTQTGGHEQGTSRAQHTFIIPPQDVREAADGAFWIVQAGGMTAFRALPNPAPPPTVFAERACQVPVASEEDEFEQVAP